MTLIFQTQPTPEEKHQFQLRAVLGDLQHKADVYLATQRFDNDIVIKLLTNKAQADWVREYCRELLPPHNPNGTPPSDHTVASCFEEAYYTKPQIKVRYLDWLYSYYV